MSKLRLIFLISLVILAGVFLATLYLIPLGKSYPESRRAQIIDAGDKWILQYDIDNNGDMELDYTICVTIDGVVYTDSTVVRPGKSHSYIHHIYREQLTEGEVVVALYEEGKVEPVDQATYYIDN
ncbi:hypothetical protein ACFLYR_02570 [Chloroflexota bacterium]